MLVAQAGVDLFGQIRIPADIPMVMDVRLDPRVLLFTILASVASALVFGLAPALQCSQPDLVPALKSGKSDDGKRRRLLGRNALVIAQVAGALLLLVFATQAYRGASIVMSRARRFPHQPSADSQFRYHAGAVHAGPGQAVLQAAAGAGTQSPRREVGGAFASGAHVAGTATPAAWFRKALSCRPGPRPSA